MDNFRRDDDPRYAEHPCYSTAAGEDCEAVQALAGKQAAGAHAACARSSRHPVAGLNGALLAPEPAPDFTAGRGRPEPKRAFLHDLALTMGAEAGTVATGLLLTSIVSRWLGDRALSEYLLLRRVLTWMLAGTMVGLGTGLPRYVAQAAGHCEEDEHGYFLAASVCLLAAAAFTAGALILARRSCAQWLFGNGQETGLVMALGLLLLGFAVHRAVSGYYRGRLEMMRANLLELLNAALLPLSVVVALLHREPIGAMMFVTGGLMALMGALFAVPLLCRLRWRAAARGLRARCRELLHYGLPRIPGEFGAATGMALGPMLAVHYMSITAVAPLLLGLNMLMVIGYAAGPLGSMLLSKVSMMLGRNQHGAVQARMRLLIAAVMEIAVFTCLQLLVFADVVVRAWVGPGFENQMDIIRLVLVAIPAYLFFVALRNTIDAASVKPFNTANVMISLTVYLALVAAWMGLFPGRTLLLGIAGSLLASQILLALLTARTFRKLYGVGVPWRRLAPSFATAVALGAAAMAFRKFAGGRLPLPAAILAETVVTLLYLAVLARRRSGWLIYTWNVGVCRRMNWSAESLEP
ncbi:MAG TPA: hypothetical protein VMA34_10440 [Terracidiphilus sp.]|nr:hypothetical protein [Terracidiphilus sp.]